VEKRGLCGDSRPRLPAERATPLGIESSSVFLCVLCVKALDLLLEQILKRSARIVRPQARRSRSLFLSRHANLIQVAIIPRIFLRDPLLDRLHALEPATGIEIRALLARMQLESTLRTLPRAGHSLQHGSALRTPRNRARARQIDGPRAKRVIPLGSSPARLFCKFLS
jgi:hypothetical protein